MARNRSIPFGYIINDGEVAINLNEAEAVRCIFTSFLGGASFISIADAMTKTGPRYHAEKSEWNKHMIKRILENAKYIGTDDYPAIIAPDTFENAQRLRITKTENYPAQPGCNNAVKRKMICSVCGSAFRKHAETWGDECRRWRCGNPECGTVLIASNKELENRMVILLNKLISNPALLDTKMPPPPISAEAERLKNEINRELGKTDFDEARTKSLIFAQAAAKYAALGDRDEIERKTEALKNRISAMTPLTAFDSEFFNAAVTAVTVSADGALGLRLINGAHITEEGDSDYADDNHD
jgi:hypothetical protein